MSYGKVVWAGQGSAAIRWSTWSTLGLRRRGEYPNIIRRLLAIAVVQDREKRKISRSATTTARPISRISSYTLANRLFRSIVL
jgi:hypothetical protein